MAAYAAVASLMNNIEQIMNHSHLSTSFDSKMIQPLFEMAGFLLDFIEGCNHGVMSKEVEDVERKITCAAHAAEDVIESHIVDQIHAGSTEVSLSCSLHLRQMVEDMDGILRKANELKEKQGFREEQPTHSRRPLMETDIVGFEDELKQLMNKLTSQQSTRHVISIVGMGGMGKTTLAHNLYQNSLINQDFDICAWATVSQQYNVKDTISQLIGHGSSSGRTTDDLGLELHKALYGRRYLIVLDDVWNVEARDEVMRFFPDNGNRSRVVLTTRLSNVARDSCYDYCLAMKPLDERYRWKLFCRKAFQQENCPHPELESVGKEIARLCRGLPLSTVVMGGLLLNSPRSLQFWENVASNIKSVPDSKEKEESLDILSAEGYLKELIDRNLISISKRRKNGKIGSCGIHHLMRDLCLKVGQKQEFFHVHKSTRISIKDSIKRRLKGPRGIMLFRGPALRSIFARYASEAKDTRCKLLRVCCTAPYCSSPSQLFIKVNLRYLAFSLWRNRQPMWELPSSVSLIWNLQTLIIQNFNSCHSVFVAPIEIWKMQQLKHIKCPMIYLPGDGLFIMDKLQTLTTAVNLRMSKEVCKMIPNIKKLHLLYRSNLHGYDDSLIEFLQNLDCLHKLESLNLSMSMSLSMFVKLPTFKLNTKLAFPTSLNKLCLRVSQLAWEDVWKIGSLPQLEVLELGDSSVTVGNKWRPVGEQFMRLKFLKISWCGLYYWEADNSHFPVLEKLILRGLRHLEEIPLGMSEIPTLELIRVEHCSESAAISAVRIKKEQLENQGDDGLQVQVQISASDSESFKEKVETEGLAINYIQLEMPF